MINFSKILTQAASTADELRETALPKEKVTLSSTLQQVPAVDAELVPESRIVLHDDPRSPGADRFRFLRMKLRELWAIGKLRSLLITSPLPGDGKSTVALNLATALTERGKRSVLLIDADFHHPTIAAALRIPTETGLAECLENGSDPIAALRFVRPLKWFLLPAGTAQHHPTELLQSEALGTVMQRLTPLFDWVVVDAPPIVPLTDALAISRHTDASLLVVRADRTPRESVEQALNLIGPKHALGIVLNGATGLNRVYSKYYGYYAKHK